MEAVFFFVMNCAYSIPPPTVLKSLHRKVKKLIIVFISHFALLLFGFSITEIYNQYYIKSGKKHKKQCEKRIVLWADFAA